MSNKNLSVGEKIILIIVGAIFAFCVWYVVKHYDLSKPFPIRLEHLTEQRPYYK